MKKIPFMVIFLFVLTCLSTLAAGALQKGINILQEPGRLIEGAPFSLTLMIILLSHELSHYVASKVHRTDATLPYFIPAPSIIGTFGAFIKMRSPIATRKALIDIGASGPIVGFIFSVIACMIGLKLSSVVPVMDEPGMLGLGESILFSLLARLMIGVPPEGYDILLHPVAFAGWIGLFVTTLNLLPIGQLDGGHIVFALFGRRHRKISIVFVVILGVFGLMFWGGWALWAVLMFGLGLNHPPVLYWETPMDPARKAVAWVAFLIFILTYMPTPFIISS